MEILLLVLMYIYIYIYIHIYTDILAIDIFVLSFCRKAHQKNLRSFLFGGLRQIQY